MNVSAECRSLSSPHESCCRVCWLHSPCPPPCASERVSCEGVSRCVVSCDEALARGCVRGVGRVNSASKTPQSDFTLSRWVLVVWLTHEAKEKKNKRHADQSYFNFGPQGKIHLILVRTSMAAQHHTSVHSRNTDAE